MNPTQKAVQHMEEGVMLLRAAKRNLLQARSDQHVPLAMVIASLEEILDVLKDPECTPAILGGE
ncbi:hypothetical protein L1N85_11235 [Paenibacillus alkaliterrae]|uniref:hypothetical protein n=1 Tax=Paenibacillus alkaliterrae TaxID=320909 RepID=UPI001F2EBE84|nr:hypothetical protein [Paenibacillus alkaliterrae]MCF2939010.1 hypothetical protein [Paenibacillus alkaliterrae]